jgi:hypothetical protein
LLAYLFDLFFLSPIICPLEAAMTLKKTNSTIFHPHRDGVTLLFVISMVVLFLLMGTTFMIVSNDYYKSARQRSRRSTNIVDGPALLDRCFYDLLRGPDLRDVESPLRGHSILADQYGYGIVGTLTQVSGFDGTGNAANGPLVQLTLSIENGRTRRILDPDFNSTNDDDSINDNDNPFSPTRMAQGINNFFAGKYNGQVISIVDGDFAGYSGRIISSEYQVDGSGDPTGLNLVVMPDQILTPIATLNGSATVVINGRDFSGVGSGDIAMTGAFNASTGRFEFNPDADPTMPVNPLLGDEALMPNRRGETFVDLADRRDGYLARDNSPNEPYDAADFQNMFLSGVLPGGMIIPSFHRDTLYASQFTNGSTGAEDIQAFSFRPVFIGEGSEFDVASDYSTANVEFPRGQFGSKPFVPATGNLSFPANDAQALDVDTDNDGINDAVWIDIGLPTQSNSEGRLFRPLVAYRVVDMDNRLNLNAHGNFVDESFGNPPQVAVGAGYGVAEISLSVPGLTNVQTPLGASPSLYNQWLEQRYGADNVPGGSVLGSNQKLFGYPTMPDDIGRGRSKFNTALDLFGRFPVTADVSGPINNLLPGFEPVDINIANPYEVSFAIGGSQNDRLFTAVEMEGLLRSSDPDAQLISSRLNPSIIRDVEQFPIDANDESLLGDLFTTHSFEVNMPATARSLPERLHDLLRTLERTPELTLTRQQRRQIIEDLLPREVILGGKLNLNRYFGNGIDNNDNGGVRGVSDDLVELASALEQTPQNGMPSFNAARAKQRLVRDLYITLLLVCGDDPPADFDYDGEGSSVEVEYHRMMAQWAVNIVDFRDADSINTPFRFDPEPFDGTAFDDIADPNFIVWGCERPEVLITETFAFHDRQNQDTGTADLVADGDDDWDSVAQPISGAVIELYNPWTGPNNFQRLGAELGNPNTNAVNLSSATDGGDPVWRIALKRNRTISNPGDTDVLRTIFFVDPGTSAANAGTDSFFPSNGTMVLAPGDYGVLKPVAGNNVPVGPETITGIGGASLFVDGSRDAASAPVPNRVLNISDPSGGYPAVAAFPVDRPLDADIQAGAKSNRTAEDLIELWRGGIAQDYRFAFLQRLANPTQPFNNSPDDLNYNPYLTVDTAAIDLLAFNSTDPNFTRDNTANTSEVGVDMAGQRFTAVDDFTRYSSVERGVSFSSPGTMPELDMPTDASLGVARGNLFRTDDGPTNPPNGVDPTSDFVHSFGGMNVSHDDSGEMNENRVPFGWLSWNNRPYASHMELLNVPYTSQEMLTFLYNNGSSNGSMRNATFGEFRTQVASLYGDSRFENLLRLSEGVDGVVSNRFAHFLEFVETPSLYLGVETFLPVDVPLPNFSDAANAEFDPRVHGIPTFRRPGKININTMSELQEPVWNNLVAGYGEPFSMFQSRRNGTPGPMDPTDFELFYTTIENAAFVPENPRGILAAINVDSGGNPFNAIGATDQSSPELKKNATSSYFANELKQKMGNLVTTRSSVFAIWITVGYFEVDQFGRLGAELTSEAGDVNRNRGFYIVDRSIPVAFEPGKNHNVDRAVLVRSIIE